MFKTATRVRFYVWSVFVLLCGTVGNGYYANHLYGHFDIAFTLMAKVMVKGLPFWLPMVLGLNLCIWSVSAILMRMTKMRPLPGRKFYVAMNCIVMLLSADFFFAVVSAKIETFAQ